MSASGHVDYEYINENEIDDELKCVICKQPFVSPVSLSVCQHTFCKPCIKQWLNRTETCPTCRQEINCLSRNFRGHSFRSPAYVPINTRIVLNQLDRLLVRCLLCNETNIQRGDWKDHEKNCIKKIVQCTSVDIKCPWEGSRDTLSTHLNNCTFQQVRPIIDELKTELKLTQTTQIELKKCVTTLESKVNFLLKLINKGNFMSTKCAKSMNECKYYSNNNQENNNNGQNHRNRRFTCSICHDRIRNEDISLHACLGDCICRSCVNSQYAIRRPMEVWGLPTTEDYTEGPEDETWD